MGSPLLMILLNLPDGDCSMAPIGAERYPILGICLSQFLTIRID